MEWFTSKLSGEGAPLLSTTPAAPAVQMTTLSGDGAPAPAPAPAEASSAKAGGGGGSGANGLDPSLGVKAIGYFGSFALTINNISGR